MTIQTNEVSKSVWLKNESNPLFHHLVHAATQTAQLYKTLQSDSFCQLVHFDPIRACFEFFENGAGCLQNQTVNLGLLRGEFAVNGKRDGHIGAVVMKRVALVCQHRLATDQGFVVVVVV